MKKKIFLLTIFSLILFISGNLWSVLINSAVAVKAATTEKNLTVQPSKLEISAKPGTKIKKSFTLINRGDMPLRLKLEIKDFSVIDEKGKVQFQDPSDQGGGNWLIPEFQELTIKPLQARDISLIVSVPDNATGGGHYGAIIFNPISGGASLNGTFGILVWMTVLGNSGGSTATTGGKITAFSATKFGEGNPVEINLSLQNQGNTHLVTNGEIVMRNWLGREVASFDLGSLTVYPGMTRDFVWKWNNSPMFGVFRPEIRLVNSNKDEQKFSARTWFIVFPWRITLLFLIALAAAVFVFLKLGSRNPYKRLKNELVQENKNLKASRWARFFPHRQSGTAENLD